MEQWRIHRNLEQGRIGKGTGVLQVDGGDVQECFVWKQPEEEKSGSIGSVTKEDTGKIIDQDGYDLIQKPR